MVVECIVIFGIIFAIFIICLKNHSSWHAFTVLPLMVVPLANIIVNIALKFTSLNFQEDFILIIIILLVAVGVSSTIIGVHSGKIKVKSHKIAYIVMSILFNFILTCILIVNSYNILLPF